MNYLGAPWRKDTTIMCAPALGYLLTDLGLLKCTHASHVERAVDIRESEGSWNSKRAAAYPARLNAILAGAMAKVAAPVATRANTSPPPKRSDSARASAAASTAANHTRTTNAAAAASTTNQTRASSTPRTADTATCSCDNRDTALRRINSRAARSNIVEYPLKDALSRRRTCRDVPRG